MTHASDTPTGIFTEHYATREEWMHRATENYWRAKIDGMQLMNGDTLVLPETIHISVGFAGGSRMENINTRGCCWTRAASSDGANHIFISPALDDTAQILLTLGHELIHAALDCADGHRGRFAEVATRLGFTGSMTSSQAGTDLGMDLIVLAEELGEYPHGQLRVGVPVAPRVPVTPGGEAPVWITGGSSAGRAQTNRHVKVSCPSCPDYHLRMSRTMIAKALPLCGICGTAMGIE